MHGPLVHWESGNILVTTLTDETIAGFYDEFGQRMINDYVFGNARVEKAIERVCTYITPEVKSLLDLGCGIGISSAEFSARFPHVSVRGVDISSENIRVASSLFKNDSLDFQVSTISDGAIQGTYDVIALIDAYEHVPLDSRENVHNQLKRLLSPCGLVVITVPSPLHQADLHARHPEKLQIVDEVITIQDALKLARDLNAEIICFEYVSIWKTNDYLHVVIQRTPRYVPLSRKRLRGLQVIPTKVASFLRRWYRRNKVRKSLHLNVAMRQGSKRN